LVLLWEPRERIYCAKVLEGHCYSNAANAVQVVMVGIKVSEKDYWQPQVVLVFRLQCGELQFRQFIWGQVDR